MTLSPKVKNLLAFAHDDLMAKINNAIEKGQPVAQNIAYSLTLHEAGRKFHTCIVFTWDGQSLHLVNPQSQVPQIELLIKSACAIWN